MGGLSTEAQHAIAQDHLRSRWTRAQLRVHPATLLFRVGVVSSAPFFAYLCYRAFAESTAWLAALYVLALVALSIVAFWRRPERGVQSGALLIAAYGLAFVTYLQQWGVSEGRALLVAGAVSATLLLGRRSGLVSVLLGIAFLTVGGWFRTGGEAIRLAWPRDVLVLGAIGGTLVFAVDHVVSRLAAALDRAEQRTNHLESRQGILASEQGQLERQNALLTKRSEWLCTAARVALDLGPELEEEELLEQAARLTGERFGFFHVGIFVLDPAGEWAELRAASSTAGERMLARRHRLRVGQEGLIGYVTARGEARVAGDVDVDALYYANPDLPETRSEVAVPLRLQGRVIGALDVQDTMPGAFQEGDVVALQVLADLMAVVLGRAQLTGQLQRSVAAERRSYAELSAQAWLERARVTRTIGYRYDQGGVTQLLGSERGEDSREGGGSLGKQTWPLGVRGRIVGSVEAHKHAEQGEWSLAERELMRTIVEELGAALESARLYEDAQFRASGDRLVADVTGRIRETLDPDMVLRTVAEEVFQALELDEIVVHLVLPEESIDGHAPVADEWRAARQGYRHLAVIRNDHGLVLARDAWRPGMSKAVGSGQVVSGDPDRATVVVPVLARDQVIAVISARKPEAAAPWAEREIVLLQAMCAQVGQALENARLYETVQRGEERERLLGQAAARMRESLDVGTVLRVATDEIRRALGLAALEVRLEVDGEADG